MKLELGLSAWSNLRESLARLLTKKSQTDPAFDPLPGMEPPPEKEYWAAVERMMELLRAEIILDRQEKDAKQASSAS